MSNRLISSIHVQKLGHKLQEIRERTLSNIISKLEHGFIYDNDLARSKEILSKLFEWFELEPCTRQEDVLKLIRRILKSESGSVLVKHYGSKTIVSELNQIHTNVDPGLRSIIDEVVEFVKGIKDVPEDVPPLQSDMPLSYRTQATDEGVPNTPMSLQGFVQQLSTVDDQTRRVERFHQRNLSVRDTVNIPEVIPIIPLESREKSQDLSLKWQTLVTADRNVLKAIENTFNNPAEPVALLSSCEFFCEIVLQDFPNEIFLQRPQIVKLLHGYLRSPSSSRLTNSILTALLKLTKNLCIRIQYYDDPCMYESKNSVVSQKCSVILSPTTSVTPCQTERSYMQKLGPHEFEIDFNDEDAELLKTKQILVPQYCFLTINCIFDYICIQPELHGNKTRRKRNFPGITSSLNLLDELLILLNLCFKPESWNQVMHPFMSQVIQDFKQVLLKFANVLEHFRLEVASNDYDKTNRSIHLRVLCSCANLLIKFIPLRKADSILPRELKNALANMLLDSALARLYPDIHETIFLFIKELQGHFEIDSIAKYKEVKMVCDSMTSFVKLFRTYKSLTVVEAVKLTKESVCSLEFHHNLNFITIAVALFANKLPLCKQEHQVWEDAEDVVLSLLAHSDNTIQEETYKLCHQRIVAAVGTRLNTSGTGAPGSQILFLLKSSVIVEISAHGLKNINKQIQKYANEILVHILKCKILVSDNIWNCVVEALISALPILECYADKTSALGRAINSILDPDTASTLNISTLEVFKGNLRILFVEDNLSRIEAVSRLCWMLGSQNNSRYLLPRLNSLQDSALSSICQLQKVPDLNKTRPAQHFYQPSALFQVLELLNTDDVEPVIRRSALTQISVMVEDPLLHPTFLERGGVKTIVQIMSSALIETDYNNYVDCVISAVSILKSICLYNSTVRHELCNDIEIYFYVLRGLFVFCSEERMRQDASALLCLLLFNEYVLGSPNKHDLSLPFVLCDMLTLPFTCNVHWRSSKHSMPSLAVSLTSDKWCSSCVQIHWNSEWFGGFKEVLKWDKVHYSQTILEEFDNKLCLTNGDLLILQSSSIDYCVAKFLNNIQNGTSHHIVIDALNRLQAYLKFYILTKNDNNSAKKDILNLSWEYTFTRFLSAPPANTEDTILLINCIKLLVILVPLYTIQDKPCWITKILKDSTNCFPNLLQCDTPPEFEQKTLQQELLNLITVCVWHEQQFFDLHTPTLDESSTNSTWFNIIETITDNLKFIGPKIIFHLAYLDAILSCLVHLTSALGWSCSKHGSTPKDPIPDLILELCELAGIFYCEKGPTASISLMGLNITRNIFLILNHLVAELQYFTIKGWEMCFIGENVVERYLFDVLFSLLTSRDVVLRAAVWQLLSGLAVSPRAAIELVQEIKMSKSENGIWEMALTTILDLDKASVVKENAVKVLANLLSHTKSCSSDGKMSPISTRDKRFADAILHLLDNYRFFTELESILDSLYLNISCNFPNKQVTPMMEQTAKGEFAFAYTKNFIDDLSSRDSTARTSIASNSVSTMFVTPSFVKSLTVFIHNLLLLAPNEVIGILQENSLIKMLFRCLSNPLPEIDNTKELSFYCDILEMNAAICALLTKAVSNNQVCLGTVLQTRDCLNVMLSLLNPSLYFTTLPQLIYLRNRLWTEIFGLIGTLLDSSLNKHESETTRSSVRTGDALNIVSTALSECGHVPFLQTLCEAISSNHSLDLQHSALTSLTSLLRIESKTSLDEFKMPEKNPSCTSIQQLLDTHRTPRTPSVEGNIRENLENLEPVRPAKILWERTPKLPPKDQISLLQDTYFGNTPLISDFNKNARVSDRSRSVTTEFPSEDESLMAGAELCRILLHLYDVSSLKVKENKHNKKKGVIINTLTSILCVSQEAKKLALQNGLVEMIVQQLRDVHIKLSLQSVECLRRLNDKKRVSPLLKELGCLVGLVTNFMLGDEPVKCAFAIVGLADLMHKLWVWFCVDRSLLVDALKLLCTFTTDCFIGCQSLPLTSSVAGSGPRKLPGNVSLLHEIVALISKEMELVSRNHELTVLELAFNLLHNSCAALECRCVLTKSNLLQCLSRLNPAITKRQKPWDNVELIWLEFLLTLTAYPEGQACLAKTGDVLDLVMMFTASTRTSNKKAALLVIRNVAFHLPNRPKLLNCDEFLKILQNKLTNGNVEEQNIIVTIMWALSANSQKAKLVLKCAGLDVRLQDCLKRLNLLAVENTNPDVIRRMHFVLGILKEGDKTK